MKKASVMILTAAVVLLSSCSGKLGALSSDNFKVAPNPLETDAGVVTATISGTFPEKYMNKKAVVRVIPQLQYVENGMLKVAEGQSATFQGEKVLGNDQSISYLLGGHYNMKTSFDYVPAMHESDLYLAFDARIGKKRVEVPSVRVAQGVVATSELYRQTLLLSKGCLAPDAFQRVVAQKQNANIRFLIQQAELRKSELKTGSVQEFVALLQRISKDREGLNLQNVEVSAYASPDGGFELNEKLASRRQQNAEGYVKQQMKQARLEGDVEASYTAQDWEGFQQLVQASDIQDKDVILRVLSMYKDPEEREQQIKNMSAGFRELADGILPELRRARLTINYDVVGRDDQQIKDQLAKDASQLSIEEILYAATLTNDMAEKEKIYQTAAALYPADLRAVNNLAVLAWQKGDYDTMLSELTKAQTLGKRSGAKGCPPEVEANLGLYYLKNGQVADAENHIGSAAGANDLAEALGNLHLAQGNYALAAQDMANTLSNSAGLAQLLTKDYEKAAATLRAVKPADGMTYYLQALVCARQGNDGMAGYFLRQAVEKDPSLAAYSEKDLELKSAK